MTATARPCIPSPFKGIAHTPKAYDGRPPSVADSGTSRAAADSMAELAGGLRLAVLEAIRSSPEGATCDELEIRLGMRHQTASARCRELVLMGLVSKQAHPLTGAEIRRATRSGRHAAAFRKLAELQEYAEAWMAQASDHLP